MRSLAALLLSALAVVALCPGRSSANPMAPETPAAPTSKTPASDTESSHETAEADVLRVFSAEDDGHRFVAYLVSWKGREVVVSDPISRSDYAVGDSIRFLVHKGRLRAREGQPRIAPLGFLLTPAMPEMADRQPSTDEEKRGMRVARGDLDAATNPRERFYALGAAAMRAMDQGSIDEARQLAVELEKMTPLYQRDWNYGNAIQDANQVLGRIALADGNVEEAKGRLLASAESKGSPQMNSFGPNMKLAKELLEQGEKETVLEYFQRCRKFWAMGGEKLSEWTDQVERGETPEFGANLDY
ncbi:hypothetical protein Pla108_37650 [Botrimarina colliarenosi]|uniref:Tetratricopeptide repeat protein n=1 Tax=Botrimarina colliarenosi TaxID=2528001 RepID=A0A5C6A6T2_9BACT|nr:hypothetical protein [Botrimarina colliarenosi]TWT94053.1 hypothetical protein Pla108_37650 [Botrimarina colliarenosi]